MLIRAHTAEKRLLLRNDLEELVRDKGFCDPETLAREIGEGDGVLVILDCEGYEIELFDTERIPALADCTLLIELHFFAHGDIRETILERCEKTHSSKHIFLRSRVLEDFSSDPGVRFTPAGVKRCWMLKGCNEETEWPILRSRTTYA